MPTGGAVDIFWGSAAAIRCWAAGSTTRIVVADAGQGVPEDFVPRLFDRFSRAGGDTRPGTGLGLHLARRLCRVMGGDLTYLPPADGQGPRFVVSLASG